MQNDFSRRDFIKTSMAVAGAGRLMCGVSGCDKDISFAIPAGVMNTLGATSFTATMQEYNLSQNVEWTSWVNNTGRDLRAAFEKHEGNRVSGFAWEFRLLQDNTINAWCMPGARIAFYDGIMPLCRNADGVAIVMGHEIAHAVYNHSGQRMAQQLGVQLGITALNVAISRVTEPDAAILNIANYVFGVGGQLGLLAYSRKHEYQADKMGLIYAAKAGYDPREAPRFWQRMSALGSSGTPEFLSTHPSHGNRIQRLNEAMDEALKHYNPS